MRRRRGERVREPDTRTRAPKAEAGRRQPQLRPAGWPRGSSPSQRLRRLPLAPTGLRLLSFLWPLMPFSLKVPSASALPTAPAHLFPAPKSRVERIAFKPCSAVSLPCFLGLWLRLRGGFLLGSAVIPLLLSITGLFSVMIQFCKVLRVFYSDNIRRAQFYTVIIANVV